MNIKEKTLRECSNCQIVVSLPPYRVSRFKFCSKQCKYDAWKKHTPWNKGLVGVMPTPWNKGITYTAEMKTTLKRITHKSCVDCGTESRWIKTQDRCHKCWLKSWQTDITNHPRWKRDRSTLAKRQERNDMAYKEWRKNVINRDRHRCVACGYVGFVEADHKYSWSGFPRLRYMVENGQALCRQCHKAKTAMERRGLQTINIY
jgi:5-methylcytosine-specific restriction endonuclease McrA